MLHQERECCVVLWRCVQNFEVREHAVVLMGRLTVRNPAYVLPALRRHLVQLLVDIEHSTDSRQREDGARILACLIRACTLLMLPYLSPILKVWCSHLKTWGGGRSAQCSTMCS